MKKLSKEQMKKVMGGQRAGYSSPCSTGTCGPEGKYNCSAQYTGEQEEQHDPVECCCGHSDYDYECMGA